MKFRLTADVVFEANDIEHALRLLSLHFLARAEWAPGTVMEFIGQMAVEPDNAESSGRYVHLIDSSEQQELSA